MNFIDVQDPDTARNKKAVRAHAARKGYEVRRAKQNVSPTPKTVLPIHVESTQSGPSSLARQCTGAEDRRSVGVQYGRLEERRGRPFEQCASSTAHYGNIDPPCDRSEQYIYPATGLPGWSGDQHVPPQEKLHYVRKQHSQPRAQHKRGPEEDVIKNVDNELARAATRRHEFDDLYPGGHEAHPFP